MTTATTSKYLAFVRVASTLAQRHRGELYGRMVFFAVILGVFSSLWRAIADAGMPIAADPKRLVWYLATTEWILLSAPPVHADVQEAIRRGDVMCRIGQPVSYVGSLFAEAVGLLLVRLPMLVATAWVCAFGFTGWIPPLGALALTVPFGMAAAALIAGMYLWIGLLAFALEDVAPVFWVVQKLLFVLGGLMLPIELYPRAIQIAAAWTPFPSMLAGPAGFVLRQSGAGLAALTFRLAAWGCVTAAAAWWTFRRASRRLTVNGG